MSKPREKLLSPKKGGENFERNGKPIGLTMLDFWSWSYSNILYSTIRGDLAEYIVGTAILDHRSKPNYQIRKDGDLVDFWLDKKLHVEVKSSSYLQAWEQEKLSPIKFDVCPRQGYDFENNVPIDQTDRHAHVYIFCILNHKESDTVNPLNIDQWEFLVLRTQEINKWSKTKQIITLTELIELGAKKSEYGDLRRNVVIEFSKIT